MPRSTGRARRSRQGPSRLPIVDAVLEELARARRPSLRRVLNATGVLVHTNLGRAPLSAAALERVVEVGAGYSNLEYDLERGERGSRQDHLAELLGRLTGAEAALVVNNNAAAVLLALAALAEGREVVVSRGELIEIGDGFRIPDVLARSGARLVEVGTTNRTRAADYERAIGPETARAAARAPVELPRRRLHGAARARGHRRGRAGDASSRSSTTSDRERSRASGTSRRLPSPCAPEPTSSASPATSSSEARRRVSSSVAPTSSSGFAAIRCSARCAPTSSRSPRSREPSRRRSTRRTRDEVPVLRMLHEPVEVVRARAERLASLVGGEVEETVARVGGGALPLAELPSVACAVEESLAEPLRLGEPPVVALVRDGRTLLDCRTLTDAEVDEVAAAVLALR